MLIATLSHDTSPRYETLHVIEQFVIQSQCYMLKKISHHVHVCLEIEVARGGTYIEMQKENRNEHQVQDDIFSI